MAVRDRRRADPARRPAARRRPALTSAREPVGGDDGEQRRGRTAATRRRRTRERRMPSASQTRPLRADPRQPDEDLVRADASGGGRSTAPLPVPAGQTGAICFVWSISCCRSNGLPTNACAPLDAACACACSSTWPLNMTTGIAPAPYCSWIAAQHLPAVDVRHHHVEQDEVGLRLLDRGEALVRAAGLAHGVALELEVDADELAHLLVVVDEQDERARLRPAAGAGAVEERLEVGAAVAAVAAGRVEGRHAALVRPLADRALGDAEEPGRLPEREPLAVVSVRHRRESGQSFRFLHQDGHGMSVFVVVTVKSGFGLSWSASPSAIPTAKRTTAATRRRASGAARRGGAPAALARPITRGSRRRRAGRRRTRRRGRARGRAASRGEGARSSTASRAQRSASR